MLNTAYHYLDLVPKGRDEAELEFTQAWVRRQVMNTVDDLFSHIEDGYGSHRQDS